MSIRDRVEKSKAVPLDLYHVYSNRTQVLVVADLPGVNASEIFFAIDPGLLTICSETRPGQGEHHSGGLWQLCREMRQGRFSYTVRLPRGLVLDRWSATFEDGEFRLRIPRAA
jgi:HSP20 family molecular chaperone IbpA